MTRIARFEAVLFDCDGVLVDSETITNRVLCAMLNEAGYIVLRFTEIPSIRQLHKHIGITPAMRA